MYPTGEPNEEEKHNIVNKEQRIHLICDLQVAKKKVIFPKWSGDCVVVYDHCWTGRDDFVVQSTDRSFSGSTFWDWIGMFATKSVPEIDIKVAKDKYWKGKRRPKMRLVVIKEYLKQTVSHGNLFTESFYAYGLVPETPQRLIFK